MPSHRVQLEGGQEGLLGPNEMLTRVTQIQSSTLTDPFLWVSHHRGGGGDSLVKFQLLWEEQTHHTTNILVQVLF